MDGLVKSGISRGVKSARQRSQTARAMWLCVAVVVAGFIGGAAKPHRSRAPRTWQPPKSCFFTRNPVPATPASIKAGKRRFATSCAGCHGARGAGDGEDSRQLLVGPAVLSQATVQAQTDGALWWKITFGKRPMPGYGLRLSNEERWNLVNYLRTLRKS
jgi:mono/diheme cytochrome c family protein